MPTDTPAATPATPITAEEEARLLAEAEQYYSKDNFLKLHRPQAMGMKLPAKLLPLVYTKLLNQTFDVLDSFEIQLVEDEGFRAVVSKEGGLKAGEDVWVIDHLWTTTIDHAQDQLKKVDGLTDRLWTLANMDIHLENERREAAANTPAPAAPAAISTSARPAPVEVELDEDALAAIMAEASVSRDRAIESYRTNGGDLIQSIVWLGGESELEKQTKVQMEAVCEAQMAAQQPAAAESEPAVPQTLTLDQKVPLLWESLFKHRLVGSYFTTSASNISASALKPEDVESVLYVNDEAGSAFAQAPNAALANAEMHPLICVTLNGAGFSLLWLTKDVAQGEEVLIPQRPYIQLAGVPWPKKE